MNAILLSLLFLFCSPSFVRAESVMDHSKWDALLKAHLPERFVDYAGFLTARGELDRYLEQLSEVTVEALGETSREERIAFWINLYNASVIRMALDEYPIARFDEVPGAFDVRSVKTLGEYFSLADLRDKVLREGFRDERVLTALVSARMDSPSLRPAAFQGKTLEAELNEAVNTFLEDENKNQIKIREKRVFLSPLFREFGSDFLFNYGTLEKNKGLSQPETAVIGFVLDHLTDAEKRLFLASGRYKVVYLPEDSRLNDVRNG